MSSDRITIIESGRELSFSFEEMSRYNGGESPGGVAIAFKALERALPLLDPSNVLERRSIWIDTAFRGPGARDAFELVTRAVTDDRYTMVPELERPDLGQARARFVFRFRYLDRKVTLTLNSGFVTDEFIELTRRDGRSTDDERRLTVLKHELASAVMAADAQSVFED